jgi:hypothetical protein
MAMKIWTVISGVVSTLLVASILTFGLSTEIASAHQNGNHDDCVGPHKNDEGCPVVDPPAPSSFSIASVGKWHGRAASEYAEANGTYTKISSSRFGKILAKLDNSFGGNFTTLCEDYDVLIFEWDSPNIKHLNLYSLLNYMECGGGIIWEDTTNIVHLAPITGVIINHDSSAPSPIPVAFDGTCADNPQGPCQPVVFPEFPLSATSFYLVNSHIEFTSSGTLMDYLIQTDPLPFAVLGLYGVFPDLDSDGNGGCIVMTGPDNNFHGDANIDILNPDLKDLQDAHRNMHALLFHQLDWLLDSAECPPPPSP